MQSATKPVSTWLLVSLSMLTLVVALEVSKVSVTIGAADHDQALVIAKVSASRLAYQAMCLPGLR